MYCKLVVVKFFLVGWGVRLKQREAQKANLRAVRNPAGSLISLGAVIDRCDKRICCVSYSLMTNHRGIYKFANYNDSSTLT